MKSKKEIKEEYKLMKHPSGVFQIKNLINNKIFISSSTELDTVWNSQKFKLNLGIHPNKNLQSDWKESGEDNFKYEIISELKITDDPAQNIKAELKELEGLYIDELKPFETRGYNQKKSI